MELRVPISQEQEDVLFDYAMGVGELGMLPDERAWIRAQVSKKAPGAKILSADLDVAAGQWVVEYEDQ